MILEKAEQATGLKSLGEVGEKPPA